MSRGDGDPLYLPLHRLDSEGQTSMGVGFFQQNGFSTGKMSPVVLGYRLSTPRHPQVQGTESYHVVPCY